MKHSHTPKLSLIAFYLLFVGLVLLVFWNLSAANIHFTNDIGLSFAVAEVGLRGEIPLLGPPSHVGGRHLGPVYYWYVMLGLWLSGGDALVAALVFSGFKLLSVLLLIYILSLLSSRESFRTNACFALVMLCFTDFLSIALTPWHSNFIIIPAALFLLATFYAVQVGPCCLGFHLLSASILLQSHLGSLPLIMGVTLIVLLRWWIGREYFKTASIWQSKLSNCVTFFLLIGSWTPLFLYEVRYPSNLKILLLSYAAEIQGRAGLAESIKIMFEFFCKYGLGVEQTISSLGMLLLCSIISFSLISLFIIIDLLRQGQSTLRWFIAAVLFSLPLYLVSLSRLRSPLHHYYLNSLIPTIYVLGGVLLGYAFRAALNKGDLTGSKLKRYISCLYLALFIFFCGRGLYQDAQGYSEPYTTPYHSLEHALAISKKIKQEEGKADDFQLVTKWHTKIAANAYYYLLGPKFYQRMDDIGGLHELPSFISDTNSIKSLDFGAFSKAYFVVCPRPNSPALGEILDAIKSRWVKKKELDLSCCLTCENCRLLRLESAPVR